MSIYDIVMLAILGGSVFFGFWKGLAWQIASLSAIIISYIVAINFRQPIAQYIQAEEPWDRIGAMLILFVGTSLVIWTIYSRVSKTIKKMELKGFDRQAGALLGAFKGILLCMVITVLSVSWLGEDAHETIHHSKLGPYIVSGIGAVSAVVPAEISQYIQPRVDDFEKAIGHDTKIAPKSFTEGSRYSIGNSFFNQNNQDQEDPPATKAPAFLRGRLQWETPSTTNNALNFDSVQTSFQGSDSTAQPASSQAESYTQGIFDSTSHEFFKRIADGTKSAFGSPSQRK